MNKLKELLDTYQEKEAESKILPEDVDPKVRAGVEALVRNATAALPQLADYYRDAVIAYTVVIGITGKTAKEFAQAAESLGAIALDFNQVVDRIVKNVKGRAVGDIYNSDAHFKVIDELSKLRLEYNMVQLPTPRVNAYNDGIYESPIEVGVPILLSKNYGSALQSAVTRREIGKRALEAKFTGQQLPVVVYNLNEDLDTRFLPAPITSIKSDGVISAAQVKKQLSQIKKLLNEQTNGVHANTNEVENE